MRRNRTVGWDDPMAPSVRSALGASWGSPAVRRQYRTDGWTDPGEEAAVGFLWSSIGGRRVLDLGVGAGRTTRLLRPGAAAYTGIDSSPEMLALARERNPDADLRVGDARDLRGVDDESCDVVVFSFNGIDCVEHDERALVLSEARRVLSPGGRLLFSTLNLDGVSHGESPGSKRAEPTRPRQDALRRAKDATQRFLRGAQARWFFHYSVRQAESGPDWARWPLAAHDFRFVVHFTRLGAVIRSLHAAGFRVEAAWDPDGRPLDLTAETCSADYMHLVSSRAV